MGLAILGALVWVIVTVALLFYAAYLSARWFFVERYPNEIHFANTEDDWRIAVFRYLPERRNSNAPVFLCHGPAANHLNLDLSEEASLARFLAKAGYDTWLVELRGRGESTKPRLFGRYRYNWSFDEYVEHDLPSAIDLVLRVTGSDRAHFVGFSLGGMAGYALLGDKDQVAKIRSLVTIGAPATFAFQRNYMYSWPLRNLRWLRHRFLMRLLAPLAGYRYLPSVRLLYEPENIPGTSIRRFMVNAAANFGRNELLQIGDWIETNSFRSIDHRRDYRQRMSTVTAPALCIAGGKDRIAPPRSVKDAFDLLASEQKSFVIASRSQSFSKSYGHLDLVLGKDAQKEIFPLVLEWLEKSKLS